MQKIHIIFLIVVIVFLISFCLYFFYNRDTISNTQFIIQVAASICIIFALLFSKNRKQTRNEKIIVVSVLLISLIILSYFFLF